LELAQPKARINKKTPPITEVMRRGRNREEAESLRGDKEVSVSAFRDSDWLC
jgi:hypothetical protein